MPNISITGKTTDGDVDNYWFNLFATDNSWQAGEPGGAGKVLSATSGTWVYKPIPDKGVYAVDGDGEVVIFFRNLDPASAAVTQTGGGNAYGKGRTINWRIDSL